MNIIEATKQAMEKGVGLTRLSFQSRCCLIPTNTKECYIVIPPNFKLRGRSHGDISAAPRWNPHAADILADDWIIVK